VRITRFRVWGPYSIGWIPKARFAEEFKKVGTTAEARATATLYAKNAQKVVEPSEDDILQAVKRDSGGGDRLKNEFSGLPPTD